MQKQFNRIANLIMKPLLKSPLHFLASGSVMLIMVTGRRSGTTYTIPVQYKRDGNTVQFFTFRDRVWWKNLQDNAGVTLWLKGRACEGMVERLIFDETELVQILKGIYRLSDEKATNMAANMLLVKVGIGG